MWLEISVIALWVIIIGIILFVVISYATGSLNNLKGPTGSTGPTGNTGAPGGTKSIVTLNPGGNYLNDHYQFFGSQNTNEQVARIVMPQNATLSNLLVRNATAVGQGQARIYSVFVNSVITTLRVQMTNNDTIISNTNTFIPVNAGDYVSVLYTDTLSLTPTTGSISFVIDLT
jgi:hypothetical protein